MTGSASSTPGHLSSARGCAITIGPPNVCFVHTLRNIFPIADAKVWGYVQLIDQKGVELPRLAASCLVEKKHFVRKDGHGYCVRCGYNEGECWVDALGFADMGLADPNYRDENGKVVRLPRRRI